MKREDICQWATKSKEEEEYHDNEWGTPQHDDRHLFEMLILEGAQAGLSWHTILKKRENYREAYDNFEPGIVASYDDDKKEELRLNPGIIRNKLKINSSVKNAKSFLNIQREFGSFNDYIWGFTNGKQIVNNWERDEDVPASSELSEIISKDLKKRGFTFVGPVIIYSYLQAIGIIDDHILNCHRKKK